jgi:phenylalanine-4-hydroxylase
MPAVRVPQHREVDERTHALTGWRIQPVPGLVPTRDFYGSLADRRFQSTPYIRHHSVPFYTPEPDIGHEIVGHASMLASPVLVDLYEVAGRASLRCSTDEALERFSRVFWFTLEFGVVHEDGQLRTYGAGLLSSYVTADSMGRCGDHGRDAEASPSANGLLARIPALQETVRRTGGGSVSAAR